MLSYTKNKNKNLKLIITQTNNFQFECSSVLYSKYHEAHQRR